ncbi:hypothetical protein DSL72_001312 [Monilinia vaccinii-corymbosi]|uniref:endo-polygalacturonase n=1 Tax=Monilinia vaccinii-corymbosi TaxID=61207 RepID=A0A8A3P5S5_9HELO|nr:hypothetical protein DSL72_001312 [Monilinia vaccinii-corymbosi]
MRSAILLGFLASLAVACDNPKTPGHTCAAAFDASPAAARAFCAAYVRTGTTAPTDIPTGFPDLTSACDSSPKKLSAACDCLLVPTTMATLTKTNASPTPTPTNYLPNHQAQKGRKTTKTTKTTKRTKTTKKPAQKTANKTGNNEAHQTGKSEAHPTGNNGAHPTGSNGANKTANNGAHQTGNNGANKTANNGAHQTQSATPPTSPKASSQCTATSYKDIARVVSSCTNIVLQDIYAPSGFAIDLRSLKPGSTVTFAGTTTFGTTSNSRFDPIVISGTGITIAGAKGHVIEGNGAAYWDGLGSNGGVPKPNHFIVIDRVVNGVVKDLNIKNWPVHCVFISNAKGLLVSGLNLDNSAGDAPNSRSKGKEAAHNTDGIDITSSDHVTIRNCTVRNQDDCVAITSGTNIDVSGMKCYRGHGLSIGSVGGKANNVVENVSFSNSLVADSENGCRIKSNAGTTGIVRNIKYTNIQLENIGKYGIDIQQDYLNTGSNGIPTNGVKITNVTFSGVVGTTQTKAKNHYVLCGSGSCNNIVFDNVKISGAAQVSSCNNSGGCPK